MGQQVVFNYPKVSPKVPTTLVTPNSYPMGLTPPRKRRIEKNIFALVLTYAVFHEEFEKKCEKILKIIFTLPPWP
jgi:hypothetical protein